MGCKVLIGDVSINIEDRLPFTNPSIKGISIGMLALDSLNTDPGAPDVVVVIFVEEDGLLLPSDVLICAITLWEMSGAAKTENMTTTTATSIATIDDFNTKGFLFVLLGVINPIATCLY